MNITTLEAKMLNNIATSSFGDFDVANPVAKDSWTWMFEACDSRDDFTPAEKGVLSSLIKKGLVTAVESTIEFTEAGVAAWRLTND